MSQSGVGSGKSVTSSDHLSYEKQKERCHCHMVLMRKICERSLPKPSQDIVVQLRIWCWKPPYFGGHVLAWNHQYGLPDQCVRFGEGEDKIAISVETTVDDGENRSYICRDWYISLIATGSKRMSTHNMKVECEYLDPDGPALLQYSNHRGSDRRLSWFLHRRYPLPAGFDHSARYVGIWCRLLDLFSESRWSLYAPNHRMKNSVVYAVYVLGSMCYFMVISLGSRFGPILNGFTVPAGDKSSQQACHEPRDHCWNDISALDHCTSALWYGTFHILEIFDRN